MCAIQVAEVLLNDLEVMRLLFLFPIQEARLIGSEDVLWDDTVDYDPSDRNLEPSHHGDESLYD